ncbi:FAST kinase domain-containing protein 4-like [Daphnia pulicaria]|uniref:FAST kinase domain-containing protein 4-like n=1 Tax=Daphnia pulicaria TaxID=35523 RepID=UPI001EEBDD92|nr:FAST kinase domain-containing protein 4-like [Daphnia pulicaria]
MFRTGLLVKFGIVRITGSCSLVQTSVKRCSTSANPSLKQTKAEEQLLNEPAWVKTALDKQISSATDAKSLLLAIKDPTFNGKCAINVMNILSRWVSEGRFTSSDFEKLDDKKKLEDLIVQGNFQVGMFAILQALKSVLVLGFSPSSNTVISLENEILWNLRKRSVSQHFSVLYFYDDIKDTAMHTKVVANIVSNIERRWVEIVEVKDFVSLLKHANHFNPKFIDKMEDVLVELIEGYNQEDQTKILTVLGATQRRSTPLLRALSYHLNKSSDKFSIHLSSDILFALHRLSFHDQVLIERICDDVVTQLNSEVKSSLVGSLLTSLGQLKYRHEGCLDAICDWINHNWTNVRYQDILSLTLCLAALDFLPSNWEPLWEKMSSLLKDKKAFSGLNKSVQLDLVWSLAILNHLDSELCQSVLNDVFIHEIFVSASSNNKGIQMKINQIWAMAILKKWKLSGLTTSLPFRFPVVPLNSPKSTLNQKILNTLSNFIPAEKHFRTGQTDLGIEVDAEFIMNDKGIPLPLADYIGKALPDNSKRVAVIVLNYNHLCKGKSFSTGPQGLRERLLTQSGYRVVTVKHTEFDPKADLVKNVKYLQNLINNAMAAARN